MRRSHVLALLGLGLVSLISASIHNGGDPILPNELLAVIFSRCIFEVLEMRQVCKGLKDFMDEIFGSIGEAEFRNLSRQFVREIESAAEDKGKERGIRVEEVALKARNSGDDDTGYVKLLKMMMGSVQVFMLPNDLIKTGEYRHLAKKLWILFAFAAHGKKNPLQCIRVVSQDVRYSMERSPYVYDMCIIAYSICRNLGRKSERVTALDELQHVASIMIVMRKFDLIDEGYFFGEKVERAFEDTIANGFDVKSIHDCDDDDSAFDEEENDSDSE